MIIPSALAGLAAVNEKASATTKAKQERVIHLDIGSSVSLLLNLIWVLEGVP
jgi:hypothetical protein